MRRIVCCAYKLLVILPTLLFAQDPKLSQEPYTVCHVLQNLDLFQGRIVKIRGVWSGNLIEDKCQMQIQTDGHKWPDAILLIYTENLRREDKQVDWTFGPKEFNPIFRYSLRFQPPVYATIIGRLDARAHLSPDPKGGASVPFGYGHLNAFPARLVMKEIRDVSGSGFRNEERDVERQSVDDN